MDHFQELLWDLGEYLGLPLHIDKHSACNLLLDDKLEIQLQMDRDQKHLIFWAFIHEIPPGKFRENVLRDALRVNGDFYPPGFLAYYEKRNMLTLHNFIVAETLSADKLLEKLEQFAEEAEEWRFAIEKGQSSPLKYSATSVKPPPFMK